MPKALSIPPVLTGIAREGHDRSQNHTCEQRANDSDMEYNGPEKGDPAADSFISSERLIAHLIGVFKRDRRRHGTMSVRSSPLHASGAKTCDGLRCKRGR